MDRTTAVYNTLESLTENEVIDCWNEYANSNLYEYIFHMCEFENLYSMERKSPFDVKRDLEDVYEEDKYVYDHDVYGWQSFNHYWDDNSPISVMDMAKYSVRNDEDLGNSSIREILDCPDVEEYLNEYDDDCLVDIEGTRLTANDWLFSGSDVLKQLVDFADDKGEYVEFSLL